MISQDQIKQFFDYKDGGLYWKIYKGPRAQIGDRAGCLMKKKYRIIRFNDILYYEHRLIWFFHHAYLPEEIDHINRVKTDNRIENLRDVSHSQNMMNQKIKNHTSKYKGVHWHKCAKKWRSRIRMNGERFYLGVFNSEDKAAEVYNRKAIELFGEYAHLNEVVIK